MPDFGSLVKNESVTIHWKNLHYFVSEIYKVKNNISPDVMNDIFHFQKNANYNLRSGTHLASRNTRIILFGKDTASNVEAKMWRLLPEGLKNASLLQVLKNKLREWKTTNCPCRLCKIYIFNKPVLSKLAS